MSLGQRPRSGEQASLRFWLEVGTLEFGGPTRETTQLAANRHLRDVLLARGYDVAYQEFAGVHVSWRGTIADGLVALFGKPPRVAAVPTPRTAMRPTLDITPGTRSSISWLVRTALVDGRDAALAAARPLLAANPDGYVLDEQEIDSAASWC